MKIVETLPTQNNVIRERVAEAISEITADHDLVGVMIISKRADGKIVWQCAGLSALELAGAAATISWKQQETWWNNNEFEPQQPAS